MPEIASEKYGPDHLNLETPKTYEFVKNLFDEYLSGDDPVFVGPDVHIGTDEYKGADQPTKELFRKYADDLINLVNDYGKDPMFWGSLTALNGKTPISNDASVACWYNGYADPIEMSKQGYDLVSIPDGSVYIVPAAGYYYDYLSTSSLYNNWEPNKIGNVTFPYGFPQLKGGMFALWNDKYGNGISKHDTHDRIFPAVQTLSEKMWSGSDSKIDYSAFQTLSQNVGEAP
ncbi:family 20 glycosylhydrolase, partial [Clostridium perfringens]